MDLSTHKRELKKQGIELIPGPITTAPNDRIQKEIGVPNSSTSSTVLSTCKTVVALLDGPADFGHPLLRGNFVENRGTMVSSKHRKGTKFKGQRRNPNHTTFVAQAINGYANIGHGLGPDGAVRVGIAPGAGRLLCVDLQTKAHLKEKPSQSDIIAGLKWIRQKRKTLPIELAVIPVQLACVGNRPGIGGQIQGAFKDDGITSIVSLGDFADGTAVITDCKHAVYAGLRKHLGSAPKARSLLIPDTPYVGSLPKFQKVHLVGRSASSSVAAGVVAGAILLVQATACVSVQESVQALLDNRIDGLMNVQKAIESLKPPVPAIR